MAEEIIRRVLTNEEKAQIIASTINLWARAGGTKSALIAHLAKQGIEQLAVDAKLTELVQLGQISVQAQSQQEIPAADPE